MKNPKQKRRSVSMTIKRKKPIFKLPTGFDDPLLQEEVRDSFRRAFFAKGMKYSSELIFDSEDCPASKNDPELD
jgi:hypothetical protein